MFNNRNYLTRYFSKIFLTLILAATCGLGLFAFSGEAQAATYYVCNSAATCNAGSSGWATGNNSNNGTAKSTPFLTIQKAADVVSAGDTVIVGSGIYTDSIYNNGYDHIQIKRTGIAGAYITFKSETKWGAKIDGSDHIDSSRGFNFFPNTAYIRIENFEIKNMGWTAFNINQTSHSHITIKGNYIHDIGRRCTDTTDGITGVGHGAGSSYDTIDSNIFANIGRLTPSEGCPTALYYNSNDHGVYQRGDYATIINNIFYGHFSGWGVQIYSGDGRTITGTSIINNTFAIARNSDQATIGHIIMSNPQTGTTIQNNIFSGAKTAAIKVSSGSNSTIQDNLTNTSNMVYNPSNLALAISGNIINANPLFVDATGHNYTLQSTSLAINAGLAANAPVYDYTGITRPQGSAYDIGAYEYKSGAVSNSADIDNSGTVNIKDIQICVKAITNLSPITAEQLAKCRAVATPTDTANIKDIQVIVRAIIGG